MMMVVMLVLVVVVTAAAVVVLIMMMVVMLVLVVVVTAAAMVILVMMVVLMFLMIVVMVMAAAGAVFIMLMVMMVFMLLLQLCQLSSQCCLALHCAQQLLASQVAPGGGDDGSLGIVLPQQRHGCIQLGLGDGISTGQDDGGSGLDLVIIELAEVLHIDLDLARVGNGDGIAQGDFLIGDLVHCADNIRQLAHTGGLDEDAVRVILLDDLSQGLAEVAHQRAADAAGVHLGDVDAGVLQEAAVNADLAEFVLNEDQLLALVGLGDHFLDQGSLAGAQEAGVDIDFCHSLLHLPKNNSCCRICISMDPQGSLFPASCQCILAYTVIIPRQS